MRITFEQRVMPVFVYSMGILAFPKPSPLPLVLSDFTFADELFRGYARSQFHLEGIDWSIDLSNINQVSIHVLIVDLTHGLGTAFAAFGFDCRGSTTSW